MFAVKNEVITLEFCEAGGHKLSGHETHADTG